MGVLLYLGPSKTHILPLAKHEKNYALALTRLSKPTLDTTLWLRQARGFILPGPILILYLPHTGIPNYKVLRVHGQILRL